MHFPGILKNNNNFFGLNKSKYPSKSLFSINSPINLFVDKEEEKYRNLINIDINKLYSTNIKKKLKDIFRVQMKKSLRHFNAENHLK